MEKKQIKDVKTGEFFRLIAEETAPVWVKTGSTTKKGGKIKYYCHEYENMKHCNAFGLDKVVYVGFTY